MRISLVLAAAVGAAALFTVTGCQASEPVKGTVVEKKHEPAKPGTKTKTCRSVKQPNGTYKNVCSTAVTGAKPECYELEIRTKDGEEVEVCDKDAFLALDVDDPYDSSRNYSGESR